MEKEINSYLYSLVRLNYDGILIDLLSIGTLPVSSAAAFKFFSSTHSLFHRQQPLILLSYASAIIPLTLSATLQFESTSPHTTITHRQPSLQAHFHRLSTYTVIFLY
jgi:hypothetical protein